MAATSKRRERVIMLNFMVWLQVRLSQGCRVQKLQKLAVFRAAPGLGVPLYRSGTEVLAEEAERNFHGSDDVMVPVRKLELAE